METRPHRPGDLLGVIRHRLLVNQLVDPAEAAARLPEGMRPHVSSSGGVVVGCCLLAIDSARPWPAPAAVGKTVRAAAHRISAEITPSSGEVTRSVYVPGRHTDGLLPVLAGGRIVPGVHERAWIDLSVSDEAVSWDVRGRSASHDGGGFNIRVVADRTNAREATSEIADIVIGTELGLSPGHRPDAIESAELCPATLKAESVELSLLESEFLDSFTTAEPAETLLMSDVELVWRRSSVQLSAA